MGHSRLRLSRSRLHDGLLACGGGHKKGASHDSLPLNITPLSNSIFAVVSSASAGAYHRHQIEPLAGASQGKGYSIH